MKAWYELHNAGEVDSPALLINPALVRHNIQLALRMVSGPSLLRPHVKTHKIQQVAAMMLAEGITKFKCATIAEAEMLAQAQAPDILLAYQPTGTKAKRLAALVKAYPDSRFSCLADNAETVRLLAEIFSGQAFEIFIDLNVGMNRTGIKPDAAGLLYEKCRAFSNISVRGLHAYDGHIHAQDPETRHQQASLVLAQTRKVKHELEAAFGTHLELVMGGTPTFAFYSRQTDIETSPGTFVFWDAGYRKMMPELDFALAAVLMTRVVSIIDAETLCLDLGYKSVAAENPLPRVTFLNMPHAVPVGQSEEHLVVRVPHTATHRIGETWYAVPFHICPTVALYEAVHVVADGRYTHKWKVVARDRVINF